MMGVAIDRWWLAIDGFGFGLCFVLVMDVQHPKDMVIRVIFLATGHC